MPHSSFLFFLGKIVVSQNEVPAKVDNDFAGAFRWRKPLLCIHICDFYISSLSFANAF